MPGFAGDGQARLMYENQQAWLLQAETVASGTASIAYQLRRERGAYYPFGVSFQVGFSATPGAFQVDIQTSDIDADAEYCTINSLTTGGLSATFRGRIELPSFWARYIRAKVVTVTNVVATSVLVTR